MQQGLDRVLVVTDSTASLGDLGAGKDLWVIPLHIIVADQTYREGRDIEYDRIVDLVSRGVQVTTSQPNRQEFESLFARAFDQGYTQIVAVLISGKLSGTSATALKAAQGFPGQIHVIDSGLTGLALGVAALAGAKVAGAGGSAKEVQATIHQRIARAGALFLVDSLEHLRQGGRLSAPAAAIGTALGLKPILTLAEGRIEIAAKLRSRNAALAQMFARAVTASDLEDVEFGIHYFGSQTSATRLADQIDQTFGRPVYLTQASAVLGAHVGPGLVALTYG